MAKNDRVRQTRTLLWDDMCPQPMTREQEAEAVRRMQAGDAEARDQLILCNMRFVIKPARRYSAAGYPLEDLASIGVVGLIKAVDTYRPETGRRVVTYAAKCATNEILTHMRREKSRIKPASLQAPIAKDHNGQTLTLEDVLRDDADELSAVIDAEADRAMLEKAKQRLKPQERAYIEARYGPEKRRQVDVGRSMGLTQAAASKIEKRALRKLRAALEAMEA